MAPEGGPDVKILMTGGTGFIGSALVEQLLGYPQVRLTLLSHGGDLTRLTARGVIAGERLEIIPADFTGEDLTTHLSRIRPETMIHLAMSYHTIGTAGGNEVERVNHQGSVRLAREFFATGGRRFLMAGTCFEYGHQQADRIPETTPAAPAYDYAIAKARATEEILNLAETKGTEALLLRVFAPYGPHEQPGRIIPLFLRAAASGQSMDLSPGEQVRDYVHVEDVAHAFRVGALRERLSVSRAIYNVCTGVGYSLRELAREVEAVTGNHLNLHWGATPYRPREMMRLVGDPTRSREELGWQARISLRQGLEALIQSRRTHSSAA